MSILNALADPVDVRLRRELRRELTAVLKAVVRTIEESPHLHREQRQMLLLELAANGVMLPEES